MHAPSRRRRLSSLLPLALLPLAACAGAPFDGPSAARNEAPRIGNAISAYATWIKEGQAVPTGRQEASYAGALLAQVYMEVSGNPVIAVSQSLLPFGWMACPVVVQITPDGSHGTFGHCVIQTADEGEIFADILCTGQRADACEGSFHLTGGTARYRRIIGNGPLRIQPDSHEVILTSEDGSSGRAPSCPLPPEASRGAGRLASGAAVQVAEEDPLRCRLERLPFVSTEQAAHLQPISMKE